ncbi:MAG: MMPL family transporter, partial [Chlorobi bacterium]|nr:MMPL family transporter [Chlorobiota bacterium]
MSGSPDDFANFVDLGYQNAKITVFLRSDKGSVLTEVDTTLQRFIDGHFQDTNATITGMAKILLIVRNMVVRGQFMSIITSLVLIWLLTTLLFRSPILGLYCTAPLFFAVFLNFATMGLSGITLSIETMVTSSLAIGVGVDYAIHFIHAYREQVRRTGDLESAVLSTMGTAGTAIVFNSITVALGFAIMMLSTFKGVEHMGMLLGLTMITSAFGALTINPVLFLILKPRAITKLIGSSPGNQAKREGLTP